MLLRQINEMRELKISESGLWLPVYLKLEEAKLFLDNLRTHTRFPKLVLFYSAAFLSAARSITFHIQKQIIPTFKDGKARYDELREKYLSGDSARFFVGLRNLSEKEMYLPLRFEMMEKYPDDQSDKIIYTVRASAAPSSPSKHHFVWLENVLNTEWTSYTHTHPRWIIDDFPGGEKELCEACEEYLIVLQKFVEVLRQSLESDGMQR